MANIDIHVRSSFAFPHKLEKHALQNVHPPDSKEEVSRRVVQGFVGDVELEVLGDVRSSLEAIANGVPWRVCKC